MAQRLSYVGGPSLDVLSSRSPPPSANQGTRHQRWLTLWYGLIPAITRLIACWQTAMCSSGACSLRSLPNRGRGVAFGSLEGAKLRRGYVPILASSKEGKRAAENACELFTKRLKRDYGLLLYS